VSGGRGAFFKVRVGILLAILAGVLLYAWRDVRSRRARKDWDRPLYVAVVLLEVAPIDPEAARALRERLDALDARLADQMHRYRPGTAHPFSFAFFGPVRVDRPPPQLGGESATEAAKQAAAVWSYLSHVDAEAKIDPALFDERIYVAARPPASTAHEMVEGSSEQDGRVGIVSVELDASMADLTSFVIAHELLHTLGASDKYDATGHALVPGGLAEPDAVPLYPQRYAEVMARNRPVAPGVEKVPATLEELGVGPATAGEIGWR
jgi:hypothetical protein